MKTPLPLSRGPISIRLRAFTRLDLLAMVLGVAVVVIVTLPAFGSSASRSRLAQCFSNLRVMGNGFHRWVLEANDKFPQQLNTAEGGTRNSPFVANAWIHFTVLSNSIDPRILNCPSDVKKVSVDFGNGPNGFLNLGNRDNSLGYILGCEASLDSPRQIISGDRTLRISGIENCGTLGIFSAQALNPGDSSVQWTNLHGATGNLLFVDGSVSTLTSPNLREAVRQTGWGTTHILIPANPPSAPE